MSEPVTIDATGLLCPLPVLRLRKVLKPLAEGITVTLITTDPAAEIDVAHFCAESGNEIVAMQKNAEGVLEFTVKRGPSAPSATKAASPPRIFE